MYFLINNFPFVFGLLFLGIELYWNITRRNKEITKTIVDRSSLRLLWITIIASLVLAGFCEMFRFAAIRQAQPYIYFSGMILAIAGLMLRIIAVSQLGKSFTVDVQIAAEQQLQQRGLYAIVRHPSYSGALLAFTGLALTYGNWISVAVICIPVFLAFAYRIRVEEEALQAKFGEAYSRYSRQTKKLIPFVY